MMPVLGNVVALTDEARALFGRQNWHHRNRWKILQKQLYGGAHFISIQSGMGLDNAFEATRWLISQNVSAIAVMGVSGGLNPDLNVGDIVLADGIIEETGYQAQEVRKTDLLCTDIAYHTLKNAGFSIYRGTIISTKQPLLTQQEKESIHQKSNALAVDMECSAIAHASKDASIPLFVMRAVSDSATTTISEALFDSLNPKGTIRWLKLFGMLFRRPYLLSDLVERGKEFHSALRVLKRGWRLLIENNLPGRLASP